MYGVYKYEYDGQVIYIGKTTTSFADRFYCHSCEEKFKPYLDRALIYVCEAEDEYEADFWETVLVAEHKPILNVAKKSITASRVHLDITWCLYGQKRKNKINTHQYSGRKTRRVAISTYPELVDRIDAYANKKNVSRAELFETAMEEYLSIHAE